MLSFAWRDQLHGSVFVEFSSDAIDPAEAQQFIQYLVRGDIFVRYGFLVGHQPDTFGLLVMLDEPCSQLLGSCYRYLLKFICINQDICILFMIKTRPYYDLVLNHWVAVVIYFPEMIRKVMVMASRGFQDRLLLNKVLVKERMDVLVTGGRPGVERMAGEFAIDHEISQEVILADYAQHGAAANYRRNLKLIEHATMVLIFWDQRSRSPMNYLTHVKRHQKRFRTIVY